jgi:hypothetical protein
MTSREILNDSQIAERGKMATECKQQAKARYGQLYECVTTILFEEDPLSLAFGPTDEYGTCASTIIPRLREGSSVSDVMKITHQEFRAWFSPTDVGSESDYEKIAKRIWDAWKSSRI